MEEARIENMSLGGGMLLRTPSPKQLVLGPSLDLTIDDMLARDNVGSKIWNLSSPPQKFSPGIDSGCKHPIIIVTF